LPLRIAFFLETRVVFANVASGGIEDLAWRLGVVIHRNFLGGCFFPETGLASHWAFSRHGHLGLIRL